MKYLIEKPRHLTDPNHKIDQSDVLLMYDQIETILKQHKVSYNITDKPITAPKEGYSHFIAYHLPGVNDYPNFLTLKKGYIPGYLYLDRRGFSGWSEIVTHRDRDLRGDRLEIMQMINDYIESGNSKIPQSNDNFSMHSGFIFVAGQRPTDQVARLSNIDTYDLIRELCELYRYRDNTFTKIVVKRHPMDDNPLADKFYNDIAERPNVVITNASIHKIIGNDNCKAVFVCNSGVGFEALMHGKPVFTSGECDYRHMTNPLFSKRDVIQSKKLLEEGDLVQNTVGNLAYMFDHHFVNVFNLPQIQERLGL